MNSRNLIVIGSSTGGVRVLETVFSGLPRLNAVMVLVHHMPRFINQSVADQLQSISDMDVKVADHRDELVHGCVYVAPSEVHLQVIANRFTELFPGEKVNFVRPSIDVAMNSLLKRSGDKIIGVVLTGMGADGAAGITHIKEIDGITIAQDKATSAIYGMPKAAYETGSVDFVLSPEETRAKLIELVGVRQSHAECGVAVDRTRRHGPLTTPLSLTP